LFRIPSWTIERVTISPDIFTHKLILLANSPAIELNFLNPVQGLVEQEALALTSPRVVMRE
jgi:hypothetical protein